MGGGDRELGAGTHHKGRGPAGAHPSRPRSPAQSRLSTCSEPRLFTEKHATSPRSLELGAKTGQAQHSGPRGPGLLAEGSGGRRRPSPWARALVQFLRGWLCPQVRALRAEIGTEAIGGRRGGCPGTAMEGPLLRVQVLLSKVRVQLREPLQVGCKNKGTSGCQDLEQ